MKANIHTKLGAALAAAIIIPALAFAQGPGAGPDGQGWGGDGPGMEMHGRGGGPDMEMRGRGGDGPGMEMHRWGGHEMGMRMGRDHGRGMEFLLNNPDLRKKIGITDEQAAKIRQETLDFRKSEIRARADLQVKRLELRSLMMAETPDRAAIDTALQQVGAARMAVEKNAIDHHLAMRSAFTPEQREKLRQMREEFMHHGMGGQHGPGGPGGQHGMRRPGAQGGQKPATPPAPPAQ